MSKGNSERFMICNEQVVFTGTFDDCVQFLEKRGILVFQDLIEPLDSRVIENEYVLRFGQQLLPASLVKNKAEQTSDTDM
jgi:hypothetical protein